MKNGNLQGAVINQVTLYNLRSVTRKCLFCKKEFETTFGGARICPEKKCQKKLNKVIPKRQYRMPSPNPIVKKELSEA